MSQIEDCLVLLEYLAASGQQSLRKMQDDTGIPFSSIRQYINPEVYVRRSWDDIEGMRKAGRAYQHYLGTISKPDNSGCYINISNFKYLEHCGTRYKFHVYYSPERNKVYVRKLEEDEFWQLAT